MTDQPIAAPTPGPYHVADIIAGRNGRYGIDDAEGHHLAVIRKHHYGNPLPDQANAELFAAAPATAAERDRLLAENNYLLAIIRAARQLRTVLGTTVADWAAWDKAADAVLDEARK